MSPPLHHAPLKRGVKARILTGRAAGLLDRAQEEAQMGVDFWWRGTIPDPLAQVRAVEMFDSIFGDPKPCPRIELDPLQKLRTVFLPDDMPLPLGRRFDPRPDWRRESEYPGDFFGIALIAHESSPKPDYTVQLVFDRTAGGRLVSLAWGRDEVGDDVVDCLVVGNGAEERLPDFTYSCVKLALFLALLRIRFCPDLDAGDGRLYLDSVQETLEKRGLVSSAQESNLDYRNFLTGFWDGYFHPLESFGMKMALFYPPEGPSTGESDGPNVSPSADDLAAKRNLPVTELGLSERNSRMLTGAGIRTFEDLINGFTRINKIEGMTRTILTEIKETAVRLVHG